MFQINQAFKLFEHVTGAEQSFIYGKGWMFGLVMATLVGIVIIGGIKKIANVTDKIVPGMVVVYLLAVLTILVINYSEIPNAFSAIWAVSRKKSIPFMPPSCSKGEIRSSCICV